MNVSFDKEKMDSILKNIISNSLKYTPENGKVSISVSDTNDSWKVIIKDTGIGIPASVNKVSCSSFISVPAMLLTLK